MRGIIIDEFPLPSFGATLEIRISHFYILMEKRMKGKKRDMEISNNLFIHSFILTLSAIFFDDFSWFFSANIYRRKKWEDDFLIQDWELIRRLVEDNLGWNISA